MSAVIEQDNQTVPIKRVGAPFGSRNAVRKRDWQHALHYALKRFENGSVKRGQALKMIAMKLVEDALAGKESAIREISERLDGKVGSGDSAGSIKVLVIRDQSPGPIPIEAEVRRLDGASG
jgi:hypothetical protein